jgi:hypothetical protein
VLCKSNSSTQAARHAVTPFPCKQGCSLTQGCARKQGWPAGSALPTHPSVCCFAAAPCRHQLGSSAHLTLPMCTKCRKLTLQLPWLAAQTRWCPASSPVRENNTGS